MRPDGAAARLAILQAIAQYAFRFDGRDAAGWAALFTGDGTWESRRGGPQGEVSALAQGREAIGAWARQRYSDLGEVARFMHHQSGTSFDELGDDTVATRTLVMVTRSDGDDAPRIILTGTYHDRWRKVEGEWLIAHRLLVRS